MEALTHLRTHFEAFAAADGSDDPLYVALAQAIARDDALLSLLLAAPPTERKPALLLACLHERLLAGVSHPLAAYYPSCGGHRQPDAALSDALRDFVDQQREPLLAQLRTRRTQTNEVGRAAVLWLALQHLARWSGQRDFALLDFGCSAGLNLGVDAVWVDDGAGGYGSPGVTLKLSTQWRGARPAWVAEPQRWRLAARVGTDLGPIDPQDAGQTRWLRACLWPGDALRRERLALALHLAAERRDPLLRSTDGLGALAAHPLPAGCWPVLFNAWVLAYLDEPAWRDHCARAMALVAERGWAWISAEAVARSPLHEPPPVPDGESPGSATLWVLHWRDAGGRVQAQPFAWSHPHGRWVQAL
jgi:hypothetical protein